MWFIANVPPQTLMRFAIPIYTVGVALLVAVALAGVVKKVRADGCIWVSIFSPRNSENCCAFDVGMVLPKTRRQFALERFRPVATVIWRFPLGLIVKQPDLGTALLVGAVGFTVIFLAGLSWRLLIGLILAAAILVPTVVWPRLHDYQKIVS